MNRVTTNWSKFEIRNTDTRSHKAKYTRATHDFGKQADEAHNDMLRVAAMLRAEIEAKKAAGQKLNTSNIIVPK